MRITDQMQRRTTLSFEVFPPKTPAGLEKLYGVLDALYPWSPDWISCTYGAGGSDKGYNLEICHAIAQAGYAAPVTHYTCIHHSEEDIRADMEAYLRLGVNHVLALRGDYAPGENTTGGAFDHASGLIDFLHRNYADRLTLACSGIPESHILSPNFASDIAFLKRKQDLGAELIITQLTFDMDQFKRWLDAIRAAGIHLPIAVGVMPVLERDRCIRHCLSMNGCAIPRPLARHISRYYDDPEGFRDAGIDYTVHQMQEYLTLGVQDLHLYTLNKAEAVDEILTRSGLFEKRPSL